MTNNELMNQINNGLNNGLNHGLNNNERTFLVEPLSLQTTTTSSTEIVIGNGVPASYYTQGNFSHSEDFKNLLIHCFHTAVRNENLKKEDQLYTLKSQSLDSNIQNDQWIIQEMNNHSLFKGVIEKYRDRTSKVLQDGSLNTFFYDMKDCSQEITHALLKAVYYSNGCEGIISLQRSLDGVIGSNSFNPDCLKIYNLIMYSCPFLLCSVFSENIGTQNMFFHAPYELVASSLQNVITNFHFENLSTSLRIQMQIENILFGIPTFQDLRDNMLEYYPSYRYIQYAKYSVYGGGVGMLRYLTYENTIMSTNSAGFIREPPIDLSEEQLDYMVFLMVNVINQM